jgi:hypothetical protein
LVVVVEWLRTGRVPGRRCYHPSVFPSNTGNEQIKYLALEKINAARSHW